MFVIQFANKEAVFALVSTTIWYFIMSDELKPAGSEPGLHTFHFDRIPRPCKYLSSVLYSKLWSFYHHVATTH